MMKGLLIKDFKLMKVQKNFFLLIVAIGIGLVVFSDDISFTIGFMTFVISLFALSSVSYDEFDNGNAFLFSLPITRNGYVLEKYLFGITLLCGSWFLSTFMVIVAGFVKDFNQPTDIIMTALGTFPVILIILAVMLPVQLKFGGEKSRVAIIGAVGLMFVLGTIVVKIAKALRIDLVSIFNRLSTLSMVMIVTIAVVVALIALLLSIRISVSIMSQKEF